MSQVLRMRSRLCLSGAREKMPTKTLRAFRASELTLTDSNACSLHNHAMELLKIITKCHLRKSEVQKAALRAHLITAWARQV